MVLSMLLALTTCPAMLGTQESIRDSQYKAKREEHRGRRSNLIASCVRPSIRSAEIDNKSIVLFNKKLYINTPALLDEGSENEQTEIPVHPFSGYFLPYPDSDYEGLVSTITDVAPILNWIYVDKETYEVKYGVRDFAQPNFTGPFDATRQDRRMMFEGWEGFAAVEELPGIWALYFDRDDDGLKSKVPFGTRVLEVELTRKEKKLEKPAPDAAQNLGEMMTQHKEKTAQEEKERQAFYESQEKGTGETVAQNTHQAAAAGGEEKRNGKESEQISEHAPIHAPGQASEHAKEEEPGYQADAEEITGMNGPRSAQTKAIYLPPTPTDNSGPSAPIYSPASTSFWSDADNTVHSDAETRITAPSTLGRGPESTTEDRARVEQYKKPSVEAETQGVYGGFFSKK